MSRTKLAAIAPLLLLAFVLPAIAAGTPKKLVVNPADFKDLPGVSANPRTDEKAYECRTVIRRTDRLGEIDFLGDSGMPYLAYRCERDGLVYEGTRPPLSWKWAPGINPHSLPE